MTAIAAVLEVSRRRRIWRVTLDGVFYGDYRTQRHATESVEAAARTLRAAGRDVKVVSP